MTSSCIDTNGLDHIQQHQDTNISVLSEDAKLSLAEEYKNKGNAEYNRGKSGLSDAYRYYTSGIEIECNDKLLHSGLLCNRAAVLLVQGKFVMCVDDCRRAIRLQPNNVKVYWRGAKASVSLELWRNAYEFCVEGLKYAPTHTELNNLKMIVETHLQKKDKHSAASHVSIYDDPPVNDNNVKPIPFNKEEAIELQREANEYTQTITSANYELKSLENETSRFDIVETAMKSLGQNERPFRQVGRMFIRCTAEEILKAASERRKFACVALYMYICVCVCATDLFGYLCV
eukprot:GHVR01016610.1.p1 GENE.GHVR01016610.1~~GHVR01016610.1.p1  ORF type:complete len:288 (+),score=67.14 GHVR01016610.1:297-1160(+)